MSNLYMVAHTAEGKKIVFECTSLPEEESKDVFDKLLLTSDQELFYHDEQLTFREVISWKTKGECPK